MSQSFTVACVQNGATGDIEASMAEAEDLVRGARDAGASLICLPEYFTSLDVINGLLIQA